MNRADFKQMLTDIESAGIPITYYSYPDNDAPSLPYAVYFTPSTRAEAADDKNHARIQTLYIELYTENKDILLEETLEEILDDYSLVFDKTEAFLQSENMFDTIYQMEDIEIWAASDTV